MEQKIERMSKFRARMELLCTYIATGKYVEGMADTEKRNIRNQANTHVLQNNTLYYIGTDNKKREVIMSAEKAQEVIGQHHLGPMGSHRGIEATLSKITRHYRWKGVKEDVKQYVTACEICQKHRNSAQRHFWRRRLCREPNQIAGMDAVDSTPYYIGTDRKTKEVVMSAERAQEVKGQHHLGPVGSRRGIEATLSKITRRYRWKGVKEDVKQCVAARDIYQKNKNQKTCSRFWRHHSSMEPDQTSGMNVIALEICEDIVSDSLNSGPSQTLQHEEIDSATNGNTHPEVDCTLDDNRQHLNMNCVSSVGLRRDTDGETDCTLMPTNQHGPVDPPLCENVGDCSIDFIVSEESCYLHCHDVDSVPRKNEIPLNIDCASSENALHPQAIETSETTHEKCSISDMSEHVPRMFDTSTRWTDVSQQDHSYTKMGSHLAGDGGGEECEGADDAILSDSQRPGNAPSQLPSVAAHNIDALQLYSLCLKQAKTRSSWANSLASGIVASSKSAEGTQPPVAALSGETSGLTGGCASLPTPSQTCLTSGSAAGEENLEQMWLQWLRSEIKNNELQHEVMTQQLKFMKQQETLYQLRKRELFLRIKRLEQH